MQEHTITIERLVNGGNGMGRLPDGKAIFIPFVLPGEVVRVAVREEKKRHAFGNLIEVVEANPIRIKPQCVHFQQCGGCHYQHIPYEDQIQTKRSIFSEQLTRLGGIEQLPPIDCMAAKNQWHYRNAVQFHATKKGALAFMDAANAQPFPVKECWLPMDAISTLWPQISLDEQIDIKRMEMRQNDAGDLLMVVESHGNAIPEMEIALPISVVHIDPADEVVLSGDPFLVQTMGVHQFRVSAKSFFQTNFEGATALVNTVKEITSSLGGILLDLYCGVGFFSRFLAEQFDEIVAIEQSQSACDDYLYNMREYGHFSLYQGAVEHVLPDLDIKADCVVVDPPRKGIDRHALDAIAVMRAPVVVYVSCDPSTLARDIKRFSRTGYQLKRSTIIDMFPQTHHIESVNLLKLK